MIDLKDVQWQVGRWSCENFGIQPPHRQLLGLVEEVGELAHARLKYEQGIRGTESELRAEEVDAVGDIMIYLLDYCHNRGIDAEATLVDTWAAVSRRDWKHNAKTGQ
jgi:NTP pyrophosphatase (non-canonical NTP hydrolase)